MFRQIDADNDGNISKEELKNIFGGSFVSDERGEQVWDEIMGQVDKDQDGLISFDEFTEAMRDVIDRRATFSLGVQRLNPASV